MLHTNTPMTRTLTVYVHIPFCIQKCGYCDFNAYLYRGDLASAYAAALRQEIVAAAASQPWPAIRVPSVYFGGGTPSTLAPEDLVGLLQAIQRAFPISDDAEITIEADPGTIDLDGLVQLRQGGFNRISLGVQAFDDALLKQLDRLHTAADARQALAWARRAGFWDLNLDLMFGLPGQTCTAWGEDLTEALTFMPAHLSVYGLTIEARTPFYHRQRRGQLTLPDDETQAAMFEQADQCLTAAGYHHYEISNYALPGWQSRHNTHYWNHGEYLGFGAGAHAYLGGYRWENERLPARYIRAIADRGTAAGPVEHISDDRRVHEGFLTGLRRQEGIDLAHFVAAYSVDVEQAYAVPLTDLIQEGYVEVVEGHLRLTGRGRLVADAVLSHLMVAETS